MNNKKKWQELIDFDNHVPQLDTPSYREALNAFLPHATDKQVIFLWERSQKEMQRSNDEKTVITIDANERRFFASLTMLDIAPYVPVKEVGKIIRKIDITDYWVAEGLGETILHLSNSLEGDMQKKYLSIGWDLIIGQVGKLYPESQERISKLLPPEFAWSKWKWLLENTDIFKDVGLVRCFSFLNSLSTIIPQERIREAIQGIQNMTDMGAHPDRKEETISILRSRLSP